jgi:PncC family amidohydrolase
MRGYELSKEIGRVMGEKAGTLSLAESCTGGYVSSLITDIPGSSSYFLGAVVSYSNEVKQELLNVDGALIKDKGAVSAQVAEAMASGIRRAIGSDIGAGITGIAGPSGGTEQKPVGVAYIGFDNGKDRKTRELRCEGTRGEIKEKFAQALLEFILENIQA